MSVEKISISSSMCFCSSAPSFEDAEIARRLRIYGIEPTGDKQVNRTKLHEIELKIAKSRNEALGGLLTIPYGKEQKIINNKKLLKFGNKKNQIKETNKKPLEEDDIKGRQILAIIDLKKQEEAKKDKKKSDKLKLDKPTFKAMKKEIKESYLTIKPQILPDLKPDIKETNTKEVQN